MNTTVEPLEGNKVKLSIQVDEQEFERAVDAAFKKIAREVRIPGFRPGKAPRRLLEARIGTSAGRVQALQDALPDYYLDAVRAHEVDVIAAPEFDVTSGEEEGPVHFDAVVEVRPTVEVDGYAELTVTIPAPVASDDEIAEQIERTRGQYAELEVVERAADDGDFVTIDIEGSQDGEVLDGLVATAYLYELGSASIVPELDEALRGAEAGAEIELDAAHPNDSEETPEAPLHFEVSVTEVKAKVLPDLDDAFAAEASDFETLAEWRDDLVSRMTNVKRAQAQVALRERIGEALAGLVADDLPESLVTSEMQERLQDMAMRLQAQGLTLEQWMQFSGTDQESFVADLRETAATSAKVDLALRAVALAEGIEVTDDDLEAEFVAVAERVDSDPDEVRTRITEAGQRAAVAADIAKRKALDWLVESVEVVDEDGNAIDRAELEVDEEAEDDDDAGPEASADAADSVDDDTAADADAPGGADDEGNAE
ncbi:trigger factor [Rhabdothermincola salaria]|uniref:trigger factor n=1 Tax=Rhabdothermincola salaria TaxID=2903142 RepID=UPI001E5D0FBE|nr:trigger factor [Rhabdothermincola salaria]